MKRLAAFAVVLILLAAGFVGCGKDKNNNDALLLLMMMNTGAHYDYYVNAAAGNDANTGSSSDPFKTITHAMSVAYAAFNGENAYISVAPGLYDTANGEAFPMHLKNGINLVGDTDNKGQPAGAANTVISNVGAANSTYVIAGGELGGPPLTFTLVAAPNIIASIKGFDIVTVAGEIVAIDHSVTTLESNTIQGSTDAGVIISNGAEGTLVNNAIYDSNVSLIILDGATNATVRQNVFSRMEADAIWVGYASAFPNSVDLGTAASPGNNNLAGAVNGVGLKVQRGWAGGNVVKASGNTWKAGVQGASNSGQYTVGTSAAANTVPYGAGNNYANLPNGAGIQF